MKPTQTNELAEALEAESLAVRDQAYQDSKKGIVPDAAWKRFRELRETARQLRDAATKQCQISTKSGVN